jgi:tetratricopeptide (TPR) repeat protein
VSDGLEARLRTLARQAELHPSDPEPCRALAEELRRAGRLAEAARAQRMAVSRRPDRPRDHLVLAELVTASGGEAGDAAHLPAAEEASIALRMAVELDPDFAAGWRELGRLDLARAQILHDRAAVRAAAERALARCRRALELDGGDAEAWRVLGDVHFHVSSAREKARECYERAVALDPQHLDARAMLAATLARDGDREGAIQALEPALRADPDHPLANEILKQIR